MELENHDILLIVVGIFFMKSIFTDLKLIVYIAIPIILLFLYKTHQENNKSQNTIEKPNMYVGNYGNSIYYDNKLNQINKVKAPVSKEIKGIMKNIKDITNNIQVIYEINQMLKIYYQFNPENYSDKGNYIKNLVHQRNKIINHLATLHLSVESNHRKLDGYIYELKTILEKHITSSPYYNKFYVNLDVPQSYSKNEYSYNIFG
jgi:hypothetical protein